MLFGVSGLLLLLLLLCTVRPARMLGWLNWGDRGGTSPLRAVMDVTERALVSPPEAVVVDRLACREHHPLAARVGLTDPFIVGFANSVHFSSSTIFQFRSIALECGYYQNCNGCSFVLLLPMTLTLST